MPTYVYKHRQEHVDCLRSIEFEVVHNISEKWITCPDCGADLDRLIAGNVSVQWKNGAPTPKHF